MVRMINPRAYIYIYIYRHIYIYIYMHSLGMLRVNRVWVYRVLSLGFRLLDWHRAPSTKLS